MDGKTIFRPDLNDQMLTAREEQLCIGKIANDLKNAVNWNDNVSNSTSFDFGDNMTANVENVEDMVIDNSELIRFNSHFLTHILGETIETPGVDRNTQSSTMGK
jgi:hypothetical protein